MTSSFRTALGLAVFTCASGAAPLSAQRVNPGEIQHRNDCRLADQVLTLGQPANRQEWALQYIGSCGEEGGDVILGLWNSPPSSDSELQALYYASIHVADERIFDVAFTVAQDLAAPAPLRLAALGTLVTYVRPDMGLNLDGRSRLEGVPPLQWSSVWGTIDHPVLVEGGGEPSLGCLFSDPRVGSRVRWRWRRPGPAARLRLLAVGSVPLRPLTVATCGPVTFLIGVLPENLIALSVRRPP